SHMIRQGDHLLDASSYQIARTAARHLKEPRAAYLSLKSSAIPSKSLFNLAIASADVGVVPETSTWMLNLRSKPAAASVISLIWSARSWIWFDLNSALATRTPGFVGGGGG